MKVKHLFFVAILPSPSNSPSGGGKDYIVEVVAWVENGKYSSEFDLKQ